MKGIYFNKNLNKGDLIKIEDISFKKPLTEIPASKYKNLIGKNLLNNVIKDDPVKLKDFYET